MKTSAADRLLTWRVIVPLALLFLTVEYFGGPRGVGLLFFTFQLTVIALAGYMITRRTHINGLLYLCILGELALFGVSGPIVLGNQYTAGTLGVVALGISQIFFGGAAVLLLRHKKPKQSSDGLIDGVAAMIGITAIQWQLQFSSDPQALDRMFALLLPIVVGLLMLGVFVLLGRLVLDRGAASRPVFALVTCSCLMGVSVVVTRSYTDPDPPMGAFSAILLAGHLVGSALVHSRFVEFCRPEERADVRLSPARWLGPASALIVTPVMFLMLTIRHETPSTPVAAAAVLLTLTVLLRISRLLRDRESSRKEMQSSESRFRSLVQNSADVITVLDVEHRITYVSGGFERLFGYSADEVMGRQVSDLFDAHDLEALHRVIRRDEGLRGPVPLGRDVKLKRHDGGDRWVSVIVTDHVDEPSIGGWVVNLHDVTERKRAEQALSRLALHDSLTGLPNRARLLNVLEQSVHLHPQRIALLFCDLDGFKEVNDILGHDAGDDVLQAVAGRWSALLRANDMLGRWGGDEFMIICEKVDSVESAQEIADRLLDSLRNPLEIPNGEARLGCSIGLAFHQAGEDVDALIRRADAAMYGAKKAGSGLRLAGA